MIIEICGICTLKPRSGDIKSCHAFGIFKIIQSICYNPIMPSALNGARGMKYFIGNRQPATTHRAEGTKRLS